MNSQPHRGSGACPTHRDLERRGLAFRKEGRSHRTECQWARAAPSSPRRRTKPRSIQARALTAYSTDHPRSQEPSLDIFYRHLNPSALHRH